MHADGLVVGQGVMLRIKGDCCPGMKPTPYKEYVVTKIVKSDRFDKKCSDVTFTVAAKSGKPPRSRACSPPRSWASSSRLRSTRSSSAGSW